MMTLKELSAVMKAVSDVVRDHVAEAFEPLSRRVKSLEEIGPITVKGEKGDDGASITVDDVAPLIAEEVAKAVSAIPVAKDGKDAEVDMAEIMSKASAEMHGIVERWLAANPPKPGKDAEPLDPELMLPELRNWFESSFAAFKAESEAAVASAIADIPTPKDGEDGESVTEEAVDKMVEVRVSARLEAMQARWELDFERRAHETVQRAIDRIPVPKDGEAGKNGEDALGFDDLSMEFDGERTVTWLYERDGNEKSFRFVLPIQIQRGVFKEGEEYERHDMVTWGGSQWVARAETTKAKPGNSEDWLLVVKKGADGRDAYSVAVKTGFRGTEAEWIESLRGEPGKNGVDRR